jgi:hypothetical protein
VCPSVNQFPARPASRDCAYHGQLACILFGLFSYLQVESRPLQIPSSLHEPRFARLQDRTGYTAMR